jgi:hypothetical protein
MHLSIVDFWVVTPCDLAGGYYVSGVSIVPNAGNRLQGHTVLQPRTRTADFFTGVKVSNLTKTWYILAYV